MLYDSTPTKVISLSTKISVSHTSGITPTTLELSGPNHKTLVGQGHKSSPTLVLSPGKLEIMMTLAQTTVIFQERMAA